jgi:hypothetical protein
MRTKGIAWHGVGAFIAWSLVVVLKRYGAALSGAGWCREEREIAGTVAPG